MKNQEYLRDCIAQYLSFITSEVKANTLANYRRHLSAFADWNEANGGEAVTAQTIAAYKQHLQHGGDKPSTVQAKLRSLSIFFSWASEDDGSGKTLYEANPVTRRLVPKEKLNPYDKAMLLSEDEIRLLLSDEARLRQRGPHILRPRNRAIVVLMLTTGLRTSELASLTAANLDWQSAQITVEHGKGDKLRYVMFPVQAQETVREYLASGYRPRDAKATAPLFGEREANGAWVSLSRQAIYGIVRKLVSDATGKEYIGGHDLRHANAELLLNHGASIEAIQTLFGHASIQTTQRYAKRLRSDVACQAGASIINSL